MLEKTDSEKIEDTRKDKDILLDCDNTHFHQFEKVLEKFLVVHGNQIVLPDNPVVFNLSIVTERENVFK